MKQTIHDLSFEELKNWLVDSGEKKFRATQIFEWMTLYSSFDEMSNVPKELLLKLQNKYEAQPLSIFKKLESEDTKKYILKTRDEQLIECVVMTYKHGNTICVSTQVGCRMGCEFCASGKDGLIRNLTSGEILSEVLLANRDFEGGAKDKRKITNIVLMGSGEPLDNYDEVTKFLKLVMSPNGINISPRNISLSTCGLAPKIEKLAEEDLGITLSISLHATTDEARQKFMPIAKAYNLKTLFSAVRKYQEKTGRRVCFEYITTKENTTKKDAERLAELTKGIMCFVNLIPLNSTEKDGIPALTRQQSYAFSQTLNDYGVTATVRRTMGAKIDGACGQLRRRVLEEENNKKDN